MLTTLRNAYCGVSECNNTQASDYNLRIILFFGENNEHQGSAKKIVRLRRVFTEK